MRETKKVRLEDLPIGKPIPKDVEIDDSEEIKEECKFCCPREHSFETVSKLACMTADSSCRANVIAVVAIILSVLSIVLHFV